jgi:hypothetical protein
LYTSERHTTFSFGCSHISLDNTITITHTTALHDIDACFCKGARQEQTVFTRRSACHRQFHSFLLLRQVRQVSAPTPGYFISLREVG